MKTNLKNLLGMSMVLIVVIATGCAQPNTGEIITVEGSTGPSEELVDVADDTILEGSTDESDALSDRIAELETELERAISEAAADDARDADAAEAHARRIAELEAELARREADAEVDPAEPAEEPDAPADTVTVPAPEELVVNYQINATLPAPRIPAIVPTIYDFAFVSKRDGIDNLHYTSTEKAALVTQLTENVTPEMYYHKPSFNNDGSRLVFEGERIFSGRSRSLIYFGGFNIDAETAFTFNALTFRLGEEDMSLGRAPNWGPDGETISFIALMSGGEGAVTQAAAYTNPYGDRNLWLIAQDGGPSTLDEVLIVDADPLAHITGDTGKRFFYSRTQDGLGSRIHVQSDADIFGGTRNHKIMLGTESYEAYDPAISPDGSKLAYVAKRNGGPAQVVVCPIEYDEMKCVFTLLPLTVTSVDRAISQANNESPCWSKDGKYVFFDSDVAVDGNKDIYMVEWENPENVTQLTDDPADDFDPACGR